LFLQSYETNKCTAKCKILKHFKEGGTYSHNKRYIQSQYKVHTVPIQGTHSNNKQEATDELQ